MDANSWQVTMYDSEFAQASINSPGFRRLARKEVAALTKVLRLKKGDRILDVPCGTGRHAVEFARRGLSVTALDINPTLLALARKNSRDLELLIEKADMSKLRRYRGRFDAVVNLFTSFGYFATELKNEKVLRELVSTLRPGGKIAIHLINRDWLMTVFQPLAWEETRTSFALDARKFDPKTKVLEAYRIVIDKKKGQAKINFHRIRLYSKNEIVNLMKRCGLTKIQVIGGYDGARFSKTKSTHPIYIGQRR